MTSSDLPALETVTGPEVLNEIHRALDRTWVKHHHVPTAVRIAIATGAAEIGANIVEHAGGSRPVPLRMTIEVSAHHVTVVFTDEGVPATVDLDGVNLPGASAKQGRGLALASAVLDRLSYHRRGNCNQWTLVSRAFD